MLESVPLQKNRLRSAKNVIFSLLCILVDRPMGGGLNPQTSPPPLAYALGLWSFQVITRGQAALVHYAPAIY